MHATIILLLCLMSVGSMCNPDFRGARDRPRYDLGILGRAIHNIEGTITNGANTIRGNARDVIDGAKSIGKGATDALGPSDGFFSNLLNELIQPLLKMKDAAFNKIKWFIKSLLVNTIKELLDDYVPDNFLLYLCLGLGVLGVLLVSCVGCCCVGYCALLNELKKISRNITGGGSPTKDKLYYNGAL